MPNSPPPLPHFPPIQFLCRFRILDSQRLSTFTLLPFAAAGSIALKLREGEEEEASVFHPAGGMPGCGHGVLFRVVVSSLRMYFPEVGRMDLTPLRSPLTAGEMGGERVQSSFTRAEKCVPLVPRNISRAGSLTLIPEHEFVEAAGSASVEFEF